MIDITHLIHAGEYTDGYYHRVDGLVLLVLPLFLFTRGGGRRGESFSTTPCSQVEEHSVDGFGGAHRSSSECVGLAGDGRGWYALMAAVYSAWLYICYVRYMIGGIS